jgi:LacI family transcriptional regulator
MARSSRAVPTVRDVARLAGVSPGTVSKVLNGQGQLRPETQSRVRAAAEDLGFSTQPPRKKPAFGPYIHRGGC